MNNVCQDITNAAAAMQAAPLALPAPRVALMPVGEITPSKIRKICGVEKKREFDVAPTFCKSYVSESKSYPYKGEWAKWAKWTNHAWIESWATVSDGMVTLHHALRATITRTAPAGMHFAVDDNGVYLVRLSDGMDYHPTAQDWTAKDFATRVRRAMAENYKRRQAAKNAEKIAAKNSKEAARLEKIYRRDLATTCVTLSDSRRAGNCVEGTLRFAELKLKVSREEVLSAAHLFTVPATKLLAVANGDMQRVEAAVKIAWSRETLVSI